MKDGTNFVTHWGWLLIANFGLAAGLDFLTAAVLYYLLKRPRDQLSPGYVIFIIFVINLTVGYRTSQLLRRLRVWTLGERFPSMYDSLANFDYFFQSTVLFLGTPLFSFSFV